MRKIDDIKEQCKRRGFELVDQGIDGMAFIKRKTLQTIICSWGGGWEHVSINGEHTPTWDEMCELKEMFWEDEEVVIQYHPAKSESVNNLRHCLHLWRPIEKYVGKLPVPDSLLVGIKGLESD